MGEAILRSLDVEAVAAIAAVALSRATGAVTTLRNPASIVGAERRNLVLRAVAVFPDGREKPVIAKATRAADYDCSRADAFAWSGFVKEWVATDMLTRVAPGRGHGAAFLAGDAAAGVMVLEDLGADRPSLVRPLLEGTAGEAADALTAWARALGRMHADAAAHEATSVEGLRRDFSSADPPIPDPGRFDTWWAGVADHLGGTVPEAERSAIAARLGAGGAWFSLVHGDPCPDNVLYVDGTARVIDYEFAERGHALWDAAHWRLGFPTCWCAGRVPPEVVARIELAYREELVRGVPVAADATAFDRELAIMVTARAVASLHWRLEGALTEDRRWGIATMRPRLLWYLEATIDALDHAGALPATRGILLRWLDALRARWPESGRLAFYPAFAT